MMLRKLTSLVTLLLLVANSTLLWAADTFVSFAPKQGYVAPSAGQILVDDNEYPGVKRAVADLRNDMQATIGRELKVVVGSLQQSKTIQQLVKNKTIDGKQLKGKAEKYIMQISGDEIIIAGSDKRGTIYGIYELSRQLGVSPWYWWADMPIEKHNQVYMLPGQYTDGEPGVRYRGIFLNDEAPCLSNWVNEKFPDAQCTSANPTLAKGFNHHFYEKVFELLLRLKANYMWPAMWGNAFYADDPENSRLADEMGIIMGTSHHEPMARNHQEWVRNRQGDWDYATNQTVIDNFFREGIRRSKDNEDIITIGMRGDGDTAMGGKEGHDEDFVSQDDYYLKLYEKIFKNQRQIIKEETGKPANKRVQLWALYKEVQHYYDLGLTVPEDVIILLCDDNWGNIRRVPQKPHQGGYGMYYHVDYVGAPRNTKWANVTPIAHLWEQMRLCLSYNIDKLWILNVGDLKPMEYPIDFFLEMAWNPTKFEEPSSIREHTRHFTELMVGPEEAAEAARIMEQYTTYNGRVTPEMLNAKTYNLANGEWAQVVADYKSLELQALYQYMRLPAESRDTYHQLLLYPVQSMANLYEMYFELAKGNQAGVDRCFERDSLLTTQYHQINGGKWNHLMREIHIGYRSWNNPPRNIKPIVGQNPMARGPQQPAPKPVTADGGYIFKLTDGMAAIEAEHYYTFENSANGKWTIIPAMGRTLSAIELLPHNASQQGASITYKIQMPANMKGQKAKIHVITNSTLPFLRREGHRYTVKLDNNDPVEVNYNSDCTEENQWHMYDVVATRVIETVTEFEVGPGYQENELDEVHTLTISPIDPGLCLEKIVIDLGGYQKQHLFGNEAPSVHFDLKAIEEEANRPIPTLSDKPLKEVFAGKFLIGAAINTRQAAENDKKGAAIIKHHFNQIVAENCMKHEVVHPSADRWDFADADQLVKFGTDNGMSIIGHCLTWHSQCAPWFTHDEQGNLCSAEVLKARMKEHITTYVQRYKGKVMGWDVVNEMIEDDGSFRQSDFYKILGKEYIFLSLQYAHEADPDAELYLNDYSMAQPGKRAGYVKLIKEIKERGLRLDGIGMQSHVGMDYPDLSEYEQSICAYADEGVKVMITELDMSALPTVSQSANVGDMVAYQKAFNPYPNGLPAERSAEWNARMKQFFDLYLKHADKISRVTFWGVIDSDSWKNNFPIRGRKEYPLAFDREYNMKSFLKQY